MTNRKLAIISCLNLFVTHNIFKIKVSWYHRMTWDPPKHVSKLRKKNSGCLTINQVAEIVVRQSFWLTMIWSTPQPLSQWDLAADWSDRKIYKSLGQSKTHWASLAAFGISYSIQTGCRHFEGTLPPYLSSVLHIYQPPRVLRSSSEKLLKIPRVNLKSANFILLPRLFGTRFQAVFVTSLISCNSSKNSCKVDAE